MRCSFIHFPALLRMQRFAFRPRLAGTASMILRGAIVAVGSKPFAGIDKLVCLGKNYLDHAHEMGGDVPEKPVLFNKPASVALQAKPNKVLNVSEVLPKDRGTVHYETEICLQLGVAGSIEAVSIGLDLTLRELQGKLKKAGHPWEVSKVFPGSAIIGPWIDVEEFPEWLDTEFSFALDNKTRQKAKGLEMRLQPEDSIAYIEEHFPLAEGDIIFTGTPAGVGAIGAGALGSVKWGDRLAYQVQF